MKDQYFGDVNDFHKYGLLQTLCAERKLRLGVCWMLTCDDAKNDGCRIGYLNNPQKWRLYNPDLFDLLGACLKDERTRNVGALESVGVLPGAEFYSEKLTDCRVQRRSYFDEMQRKLAKADLVFFDPDNGFEVDSVPFGTRNSSKYLYWSEVGEVFEGKHSVLVYQHFRREERNRFIARLAATLSDRTGAPEVHSFRTSHVVFLLAARRDHVSYFRDAASQVGRMWMGHFEVCRHCFRQ